MFGRRNTLRVAIAGAVLLIAVTQTDIASGQSGDALPKPATDEGVSMEELINSEMPYWVGFRSQLGFDTSENIIRELALSRRGAESVVEWSVPLSGDETAELDRRIRLQEEAGLATDHLKKIESFGGLYIDHHAGGYVQLNFTDMPSAIERAEVESLFDTPKSLRFRLVERSLAELREAQSAVVAAELSPVTMVAVDVIANELVVGTHDRSSVDDSTHATSEDNALRSTLESIVDLPFTIEYAAPYDDACVNRSDCGSSPDEFRGGLHTDSVSNSPCTAAFQAGDTVGNAYLISAGHCEVGQNQGDDVSIGGQPSDSTNHYIVGTNTNQQGSDADAVLIGIAAADVNNWIYKNHQRKTWEIRQIKQTTNYAANSVVCMAGRTIGNHRCGTVTNDSATITSNQTGIQIIDVVRWQFFWPGNHSSLGGSSGSPVYVNRKAMGVHKGVYSLTYEHESGVTVASVAFSKIQNVQDALGVTVRTTP